MARKTKRRGRSHSATVRASVRERRISTPHELEQALARSGGTRSGAYVTPDSAMSVAAVFACARVLADSVAMLPVRLYRELDDGSATIERNNPLDTLLYRRPNPLMTPFEFKRYLVTCLALRGNAYVRKLAIGTPAQALIPLAPSRITPAIDPQTFAVRYEFRRDDGSLTTFGDEEIIHLRALSTDGFVGLSVIQAAAEAIGLSLRTEEHGARLFSNATSPSGVLKHPGAITAEAAKRLKESFEERNSGAQNAHRTLLLEEGMEWSRIGMTSDEAQFLESRKFQRSEIAMFFGIPPHMIGDVERGTSWGSGIEQQSLGFVTYTLLPWLTNIVQGFERDLISPREQANLSFRFSTEELTRADFKTRQEGRRIQRDSGVISPNEWRRLEGMNPRDGGDEYANSGTAAPSNTIGIVRNVA